MGAIELNRGPVAEHDYQRYCTTELRRRQAAVMYKASTDCVLTASVITGRRTGIQSASVEGGERNGSSGVVFCPPPHMAEKKHPPSKSEGDPPGRVPQLKKTKIVFFTKFGTDLKANCIKTFFLKIYFGGVI